MKQPVFIGSGVAIVTPFTKDGVDFSALGRLLDFQLEHHTDAIIVCGTTGEAATMSQRERSRTIAFCVEQTAGRVPVIAGSGTNNTASSIVQSREAESLGADALLVVTPYYNKATQNGLIRHYRAVADAVHIPVILYNVPSRTGVNILPETYRTLAEHPNINGVKEASGDLLAVQRTRNLCPEDFTIWSGEDALTAPICMLGGKGVISVAANIIPAETHRLTKLCLANDYAAAGILQRELLDLFDALFCEVNPIPIKTALNLLDYRCVNEGSDNDEVVTERVRGDLRLPLCPPSRENLARIRRVLKRYRIAIE